MQRTLRVSASAGLVVLLCTALAQAAPPPRTSNAARYQITHPPATGRSGTATLEMRALLDRNGETVVEITTGSFDDLANAPGAIAKVQIKVLDADGNLLFTENFSGMSDPTVALPLSGLVRGEPLAVQANVRGIDGRRTDVVTVSDTVLLRPDLAVLQVEAPSSVPIDTAVSIDALVAELNGDVGARANCVLSVDGIEVDFANGIWVDAGDSVSCTFTHAFAAGGEHLVEVSVVDISPADDLLSNNSASTTVDVIVGAPLSGTSSFKDREYHLFKEYYLRHGDVYDDDPSQWGFWNPHWSTDLWQQTSHVRAWSPETIVFPVSSADVTQHSGSETHSWVLETMEAGTTVSSSTYDRTCGSAWNEADAASLQVCTYVWHVPHQPAIGTWIEYRKNAGTVVYRSWGTETLWTRESDGTVSEQNWIWNIEETQVDGDGRWAVGDTWTWDLRVAGAEGGFSGTWETDLAAQKTSGGHIPVCSYIRSYGWVLCYVREWVDTVVSGDAAIP